MTDKITRKGDNSSNLDECKSLLKSGLEEIAKEIDEKLQGYGEEGVESSYLDLEYEYLCKALFEKKNKEQNHQELQNQNNDEKYKFLWLGNRTHFIDDIVKKVEGKEINEELIKDILEEYKKEKIRFLENKKREFDKADVLYHGSRSKIDKFEVRKNSAGDLKPLVYFSADESFSLCFAMNNNFLCKRIRPAEKGSNKKIVHFAGHSLENLIIDHDIGGYMHYVSGDEKKNFGVGYAKSKDEFCSTKEVRATEVKEIPSALNEIILNDKATVKIKQDEVVDSKKLIETRQKIINVLSKNENDLNEKEREYLNSLNINEEHETKQELLERLQNQQENAKTIAPNIVNTCIEKVNNEMKIDLSR